MAINQPVKRALAWNLPPKIGGLPRIARHRKGHHDATRCANRNPPNYSGRSGAHRVRRVLSSSASGGRQRHRGPSLAALTARAHYRMGAGSHRISRGVLRPLNATPFFFSVSGNRILAAITRRVTCPGAQRARLSVLSALASKQTKQKGGDQRFPVGLHRAHQLQRVTLNHFRPRITPNQPSCVRTFNVAAARFLSEAVVSS
jgi:hypothetical protein